MPTAPCGRYCGAHPTYWPFFVSKTNNLRESKTRTNVKVEACGVVARSALRNNQRRRDTARMDGRNRASNRLTEIDLLVAILRFASVISRPMRDGVADPAGFSSNELRILMALSGEGDSAGHDLAELMGMHA